MTKRTTITVDKRTKEALDGRRSGETWDEFLRNLIEKGPSDERRLNSAELRGGKVTIDPNQAEEIARMAGERAAEEIRMASRGV